MTWWPWGRRTQAAAVSVQPPSELQELLNVARTAALSQHINDESLQAVAAALDQVPVDQLGLANEHAIWGKGVARHHRNRSIDYLHVYDNDVMSIGIFKIPAGSNLPLHNHPSMTVWSRVLYGSVRIRALDFCHEEHENAESADTFGRLARLKLDQCFSGHNSSAQLTPSSCNVHSLTAVEDAAVLDVLIPPYCVGGGRDCTYYAELHPVAAQLGAMSVLQESIPDKSFNVVGRTYSGQRVSV